MHFATALMVLLIVISISGYNESNKEYIGDYT